MHEHRQSEQRTRRDQVARVRTRLKAIKPEDADLIALIGVIKGVMDIIEDDGEDGE